MKAHLILMLKYPRPGEVKTRLIPTLGERRACELYRALVRHTLDEARQLLSQRDVILVAQVADAPDENSVREWLGPDLQFQPQAAGDLGRRMELAIQQAFAAGASSVVIIGTDCPELTVAHLNSAFESLARRDFVLGPAADGGYYLIGLRRSRPELFRNIRWSTTSVLMETLAIARQAGIETELLDPLHDIDLPDDLIFWAQSRAAQKSGEGKISIIIPAVNEAKGLPQTLEVAQRGQPHEIIVVDGGSTDATLLTARENDAIVLSAPRCRAIQMNRGAAIATGEYVIFLHADTLLPADYPRQVPAILSNPDVAAGAFRFRIAENFSGRRWIESTTNWRARHRQLPYGDQALFLRREIFTQLGGFSEMPIMEDYEFVHRLRGRGRIVIAPSAAITSGRRWRRFGWMRTTLINQLMIAGYHAGVSPSRLAQWYRENPKAVARLQSP